MFSRTRIAPTTGFTLVEVLIVMVIAGIIASVGYPAYKTYLLEQRRADASQALQEAQLKISEYLLYNDNLPDLDSSLTIMSALKISKFSKGGFYSISMPTDDYDHNDNSYKVVATAIGKQAQDTECENIWVTDKYMLPSPKDCR